MDDRRTGLRYEPGMRFAVELPSGELKELDPRVVKAIMINSCVPDLTPYTGYRIVAL